MTYIVATKRDGWPHFRHEDGSCEQYGCTRVETEGKSLEQLQEAWAERSRNA